MIPQLRESYSILSQGKLPSNLYVASPSEHYSAIWIRDSLYINLPFLNKDCNTYQKTVQALLDLLLKHEAKIEYHVKHKPVHQYQFIHAKYHPITLEEITGLWGHNQYDALGLLLWCIGEGERRGKRILVNSDYQRITQKIVWYLRTCEYHQSGDSGMWEENVENHASSIGSCVAGLRSIKYLVDVPEDMIPNGYAALEKLGTRESVSKDVDAAQLSLIYPYRNYSKKEAKAVISKVEAKLLRTRGAARYVGDIYYGNEKGEAEWTMFLPWLALCYMELGDYDKAHEYLRRTEHVMIEGGKLPELYYAGSNVPNPNTPLLWSNSLYIIAKERYETMHNLLN